MVGCFFRVAERERLSGARLTAALFGVLELPRDLSSGALTDWTPSLLLLLHPLVVPSRRSPREAIELEETVRRERRGCDYWCMIDFIRESRGFTLLTESRSSLSPFDFGKLRD